nr:hypothetical protein [Pandoravirus massiliensis]
MARGFGWRGQADSEEKKGERWQEGEAGGTAQAARARLPPFSAQAAAAVYASLSSKITPYPVTRLTIFVLYLFPRVSPTRCVASVFPSEPPPAPKALPGKIQ